MKIETASLVEKIVSKIEFELKPDEKHMLTQAIKQYFDVQKLIDNSPRPGAVLPPVENLQKTAHALYVCIDNLEDYTRRLLTHFRSKHDDRDVSQMLEQTREGAKWLSQKAERVAKKVGPKLPKDKGGQRKQLARLILTNHLMLIYKMATKKEPGSSCSYKDKNGKWRIGPFGRFVQTCLGTLEPRLGPTGIAQIIKEVKTLF